MTEEQRDAIRMEILSAAEDLFRTRGYDAVTMRDIAKLIGSTATKLYTYFPNKEGLFQELCTVRYDELLRQLRTCEATDPALRIEQMMRIFIQFAITQPHHYRFLFLTEDRSLGLENVPIPKPAEQSYGLLYEAVTAAIEQTVFPPLDNHLIAQSLWANAHGLASLFVNFPNFPWSDRESLIAASISAHINGFLSLGGRA